jgi:hypothetical protein
MYNIKNGHAPNYLRELIPPTVQSTTIYSLRNGSDLIIPFCSDSRLQIHPVSEYNLSVFVKIRNPVTILAASSCNFSSLVK